MNVLRTLDTMLNRITAYKLMAYGLMLLAAVSVLFSLVGTLDFPVGALLMSLVTALAVCYSVNRFFAGVWRVPTNSESWLITALILFFILPPATTTERLAIVAAGSAIAMLVKYVLVYRRAHLFNPAAFAAVAISLSGLGFASWWVGTPAMLPLVALLGLAVIRKLRRYALAVAYVVVGFSVVAGLALMRGGDIGQALSDAVLSGPLVFLGAIMLTEPSTMPAMRHQQMAYGALVALLATSQWKLGGLHATPELALVLGNLYSFVVSPKQKWHLYLKEKRQLSPRVYDLVFTSDKPLQFLPGQYMEWTLDHKKADMRGNRRTFSIASSPTETEVHLGIKTYEPSSSYKKALLALKPGQGLIAGQVNGNFVLPNDPAEKLVFIAGGIGITPFRSMVQYLIDTKQRRDIVLFYLTSSPEELSYQDVFGRAAKDVGIRLIPIVATAGAPQSGSGYRGTLTPEIISKEAPDHAARRFYISGPAPMVDAQKSQLLRLGVKRSRITTDHFSGY